MRQDYPACLSAQKSDVPMLINCVENVIDLHPDFMLVFRHARAASRVGVGATGSRRDFPRPFALHLVDAATLVFLGFVEETCVAFVVSHPRFHCTLVEFFVASDGFERGIVEFTEGFL
jgi:hypothetical protein